MIRLVYVHPDIKHESHRFWYVAFSSNVDHILWIKNSDWTTRKIARFKPTHIHFGSRASPRERWMPINKIIKLRNLLPKVVITSYRGGVGTEVDYLERLNKIIDCAFGATDSYRGQRWMPGGSSFNFWARPRQANPKQQLIFIGRAYKNDRAERAHLVKEVQSRFPLTVLGNNAWKNYGVKVASYTGTFEENRLFYCTSLMGINFVSKKYLHLSKYFSSRLIHMMQTGLPCITPYQPGMAQVFRDKEDIFYYRNKHELFSLLRCYLNRENRNLLEVVGKRGKLVSRKYDVNNLVKQVLSIRRR